MIELYFKNSTNDTSIWIVYAYRMKYKLEWTYVRWNRLKAFKTATKAATAIFVTLDKTLLSSLFSIAFWMLKDIFSTFHYSYYMNRFVIRYITDDQLNCVRLVFILLAPLGVSEEASTRIKNFVCLLSNARIKCVNIAKSHSK